MNRELLESAILSIARSETSLAEFKADPVHVGQRYSLNAEWSEIINSGNRDRLRSVGVSDGITILVSRWFKDDVTDSTSTGRFIIDHTVTPEAQSIPKNLVFAAACSHVPDLLARPEIDPNDAVMRLTAGYERLKRELELADPDVLLVTTDCHFQSFGTAAFVVGTGETHEGSMAFFKRPDLDLRVAGAPDLAREIIGHMRSVFVEVEDAPQVDLDHGLIVPLRQLLGSATLPVIPIVTQPARSFSPFGAKRFGEALRQIVENSGLRVGILATGGLSHWLDPGKYGFVDVEFDQYILGLMQAGRGLELANLEPYALLDHGQYEFMNWLIMLGLVGPGVHGDLYAYEPMVASGGGWAVVNMSIPLSDKHHA